MLNIGIHGEIIPSTQELPEELLEKIALSSTGKPSRFLLIVWAIVMRQYMECDTVYFGLHDKTSGYDARVCQAALSPETRLEALWKDPTSRLSFLDGSEKITYNTGIAIIDTPGPYNPAVLFRELTQPRDQVSIASN